MSIVKLATDDLRDVREMRKTGEIRKKRHARDNVKIIYRRFAIRLFFRTIILSLIARGNPFPDQEEIEKQIKALLEHKLIEKSHSPFVSPVTLAYKKDNGEKSKTRLCVDFRDLNKIILRESYLFPLIDDLILKTKSCKWFSVFDINMAF